MSTFIHIEIAEVYHTKNSVSSISCLCCIKDKRYCFNLFLIFFLFSLAFYILYILVSDMCISCQRYISCIVMTISSAVMETGTVQQLRTLLIRTILLSIVLSMTIFLSSYFRYQKFFSNENATLYPLFSTAELRACELLNSDYFLSVICLMFICQVLHERF